MLTLKINDGQVRALLNDAVAKLGSPEPLMERIAGTLASVTAQNFAAQGRPHWLGLQKPGPRRSGGMVLQDTGRLRDSIVPSHTGDSASIGTNVVYAAIHQFGGQTKAHVIRPKNKKALAFGGRVVKKVNHPGSKIPARPFLPIDASGNLQSEAASAIESVVTAYLRSVLGE
ncbi:phage virion morphogenesis protein [Undibacterium sp.]|uniref:phage virion morphogenesis protein n=1 Tax=Undibacterium sp. TaxID=1914977 RepID=UPI0025DC01CD|nr:phage virion morphogenesis protein [Undibacterium sp.]